MPPAAVAATADMSRGILLILLSSTLFAMMDASSKFIGSGLPMIELVWGRYAFHLTAMLPLLFWYSPRQLAASGRPWMQFGRAMTMLLSTTMFWLALQRMPLATTCAIAFSAPLVITALSVPFLGEKIHWRRWTALLVGFVGVLIVVRPGTGDLSTTGVLLGLGAVILNALYPFATRLVNQVDDPLTTILWSALPAFIITSLALPSVWIMPTTLQWSVMILIGILGFFGHLLLITAYRHATASILAPFSYWQLVLSVPTGFIAFHELPDQWSFLGGGLICASGLYVWYRERMMGRANVINDSAVPITIPL